jgi:hypothetical protein
MLVRTKQCSARDTLRGAVACQNRLAGCLQTSVGQAQFRQPGGPERAGVFNGRRPQKNGLARGSWHSRQELQKSVMRARPREIRAARDGRSHSIVPRYRIKARFATDASRRAGQSAHCYRDLPLAPLKSERGSSRLDYSGASSLRKRPPKLFGNVLRRSRCQSLSGKREFQPTNEIEGTVHARCYRIATCEPHQSCTRDPRRD